MSNPTPFEVGKAVGGNILGGFNRARESRTLDDILTQAANSEDRRAIDEIIAQVVTQVSEPNQKAALNILQNKKDFIRQKSIKENLINRGISPQDADLYSQLTTGGKTEFAKDILEARKRGTDAFGKPLQTQQESFESPEDIKERISLTIKDQDVGLTPKERVSRQKERYSAGLKPYQEGMQKLRGLEANSDRFRILDKLNQSGKLPQNLGRLNVDKRGNLRVPFFATPEAERYIKTLNEFTANAKETYGARVTNFELDQYLKRFPTLLNSQEGRNQVLQQMRIVNSINKEYYKNLRNIYKEAGGIRNIDADLAESLAEEMSAPKIENLREQFDLIGELVSLPEASQHKGKKIRNKETGEILISDGVEWIPQG